MAGLRPVSGSRDEVVALLADWLAAERPAPLSVETSGSTGVPKRVLLSRDALIASATATHERLGGPGEWTLLLPPTYVAGLQVIVRSLLAGTPPNETLGEGRYVSVVPTQLHRMLADPAPLRAYDAVLVGGASLDPALRAAANGAGVRVTATYGMSETAGGCVYDGLPLTGVEVRIGDDDGRVRLRGPMLFDGYDDDPDLTASVMDEGWFVTSDLGTFEDGRLRVLGRADDVLVTGGVKVPAGAVARRLREHPSVDQAEVVGVADEEWGQRVVAVVVGSATLAELREWVAAEHPRAWAPRELRLVEEIPLLGNGKVDRMRLVR